MPTSPARRLWIIPDCPEDLVNSKPEGYGDGTVALCYGGSFDDMPPVSWLEELPAQIGLTPEAAATLVMIRASIFIWVAYYDPTGQVTPHEPKIPVWPPQ